MELTFRTSVNNSTVEKKLVFYPNKYFVDIVVNFKSLSNSISQNRVNLMWKGGVPMTEPNPKDEGTFYASNISQGKEISKHNKKKNLFLFHIVISQFLKALNSLSTFVLKSNKTHNFPSSNRINR